MRKNYLDTAQCPSAQIKTSPGDFHWPRLNKLKAQRFLWIIAIFKQKQIYCLGLLLEILELNLTLIGAELALAAEDNFFLSEGLI